MSSSRRILGPFNRVEGDVEVHVDVEDDRVAAARVNASLFRGFEPMMRGMDPMDALVYMPRICGICSVAQSVAAATALADAAGFKAPPNAQLHSQILLATENLADHLSHFYLFFMPDFCRPCYADRPWFEATERRFAAQVGRASAEVLPSRAAFLHLTGLMAGKWPHTLALQPNGSTRALDASELLRARGICQRFAQFLESTVFCASLDEVANLDSIEALRQFAEGRDGDFAHFLRIAWDLDLFEQGRAEDQFLSYGAYAIDDKPLFAQGVWSKALRPLSSAAIAEDVSHSRVNNRGPALHPFEGQTELGDAEADAYSWCKAPRLDGAVMEVGALARQRVDQQPLAVDMIAKQGGSVAARVVMRLLELAIVLPHIERWCTQIDAREPFILPFEAATDGRGLGMIEAARGSLGHWLNIEDGRCKNYQIIAPTTWNFSPRDQQGQPGALERALTGTAVADDAEGSAMIQHIIRSFDPCMVCTVH